MNFKHQVQTTILKAKKNLYGSSKNLLLVIP